MKREILIIDDDPGYRSAVKFNFNNDPILFFEASSVNEGLQLLEVNSNIQVIILDLNLPGDKGAEFLKKIKDRSSKYRVIVLTAHDDLLAAERAKRYNVFSYQVKLDKLAVQSLRFAVERAFQDIEGEFLKKKMAAHFEIQTLINTGRNLSEVLNLICRHLITLVNGLTCHIRVLDMKKGDLELLGWHGPHPSLRRIFDQRRAFGDYYSGKVAETGKFIVLNDLQKNKVFLSFRDSVCNSIGLGRKERIFLENISSAYIIPISSDLSGNVDAILSMTSQTTDFFNNKNSKLIDEFINPILLAITKFRLKKNKAEIHKGYQDISSMLSEVSSELKGEYNLNVIYNIVFKKISSCIHPEVISIFLFNDRKNVLENVSEYYQDTLLEKGISEQYYSGESLSGWVYKNKQPLLVAEFTKDPRFKKSKNRKISNRQKKHYLAAPMRIGEKVIGIIRLINKKSEYYNINENNVERNLLKWGFTEEDQAFLEIAASHLAIAIQDAKSNLKTKHLINKLNLLNDMMYDMAKAQGVDEILKLLLDNIPVLINCKNILVSRVDRNRNERPIVKHRGDELLFNSQPLFEGISGLALRNQKTIRVDNVHSPEWTTIYKKCWEGMNSELTAPIINKNSEVRIGTEVKIHPKDYGVINIEHEDFKAFAEVDEEILELLASHTAVLIERLDHEVKMSKLAKIEKEIVGKQDWDETIKIVMDAIVNTLDFEHVNLSLIDRTTNHIKTEYITGIADNDIDLFKSMTDHSLETKNIRAEIVKKRQIEVPDTNDPRFNKEIIKRFGLDKLVRVFIPMISSTENKVIGTVTAGYPREYRPYIYERDIQVLRNFIDYAVQALEKRKKGLLDQICHEFRAPIVGIRNIADFVARRYHQMDGKVIQQKFDSIKFDTELLLHNVIELEYILGGKSPSTKIEKTLLFHDVVINTVNKLKPELFNAGLSQAKISYDFEDINKIGYVHIDRSKINQVVYNLLYNSIKYAEEDPQLFKINIEVEVTKNVFKIKFQDWGIGINPSLRSKIFEYGFRTPSAIQKHVSGSGLGLHISRQIMQEFGGDLKLACFDKPTEFQLIIPKSLGAK